jgi:hypothetical protein
MSRAKLEASGSKCSIMVGFSFFSLRRIAYLDKTNRKLATMNARHPASVM